jgi:hypothetical protein
MKKYLSFSFSAIVLLMFLSTGLAQEKSSTLPSLELKGASLLDPSRFNMYQSYSFSYFSSGRTSGTFGLYTNTLEYKISEPLLVRIGLGYLHQPLSVFGDRGSQDLKGVILPNFQLLYHPSENFFLKIDYSSIPGWVDYRGR